MSISKIFSSDLASKRRSGSIFETVHPSTEQEAMPAGDALEDRFDTGSQPDPLASRIGIHNRFHWNLRYSAAQNPVTEHSSLEKAAWFALTGAISPLLLLGNLMGCGAPSSRSSNDAESPCESRIKSLEAEKPDPALKSLVDKITFPTLDFTVMGKATLVDSRGRSIEKLTPSKKDVISYLQVHDRLFVLTANQLSNGAFAPATLLVYDVAPNHSLTPAITPSPINNGRSNAINLYEYAPVGMKLSKTGDSLHVLLGAEESRSIVVADTRELDLMSSDWCLDPNPADADTFTKPEVSVASTQDAALQKDASGDTKRDSSRAMPDTSASDVSTTIQDAKSDLASDVKIGG